MKGGGEYDCEKCNELSLKMEKDGETVTITGPEFNGCDGPPINPAPVLFEDGEPLDRCPQSTMRHCEWWEEFFDAWFWKKNYGDWPDESRGKGWQRQAAVLLDAIKIFDAELERYGEKRRPSSDGADQ